MSSSEDKAMSSKSVEAKLGLKNEDENEVDIKYKIEDKDEFKDEAEGHHVADKTSKERLPGDFKKYLFMAEEVLEELRPGDCEVEDADGKIHIVYRTGPPLSAEEELANDNAILAAVKSDSRYEESSARRTLTFHDIIKRAKVASADRYQLDITFADNWKDYRKVPKERRDVIQCNNGDYIETGTNADGSPKLRQLTEDEMKEIDSSDSPPCSCKICEKRRENSAITTPAPGWKKEKKGGMEKDGEGPHVVEC